MTTEAIEKLEDVLRVLDHQQLHIEAVHVAAVIDMLSVKFKHRTVLTDNNPALES